MFIQSALYYLFCSFKLGSMPMTAVLGHTRLTKQLTINLTVTEIGGSVKDNGADYGG